MIEIRQGGLVMAEKIRGFFKKRFARLISKKADAPLKTDTEPTVVLLSNHKTAVFLSADGHMAYINGREAVFFSEFDRLSLRGGMEIFVDIDGTVFPTVPLGEKTEGFHSEFAFLSRHDRAEYHSTHHNNIQKYEIRLMISVLPDKEMMEISCAVAGDYHTFSVYIRFEPILAEWKYYFPYTHQHPSLQSQYLPREEALLFYHPSADEEDAIRYFGITASHGKLRQEKSCFPCFTVKSGTVDFGQKISFYFGEARGKDEMLYLLDQCRKKRNRKQRKRKMGMLLHLQYTAAGLSQPADAFESFLLRRFLFGKPHVSTDKIRLWEKFGIYGDNPLVLVRFADTEKAEARLSLLLRFFKYHCIRGLRYDLLLFYRENDGNTYTLLTEKIRKAGCENLHSFACGMFLLDESLLSDSEKMAFRDASAVTISLSEDWDCLK